MDVTSIITQVDRDAPAVRDAHCCLFVCAPGLVDDAGVCIWSWARGVERPLLTQSSAALRLCNGTCAVNGWKMGVIFRPDMMF